MSSKRTATTDLNHDNWDQEEEEEVSGTYRIAPVEVLAKRRIKTATRRLDTSRSTTDRAEKSKSNKNVLQSLGGAFLSRPTQVINQSTTSFLSKPFNLDEHTSKESTFSSTTFQKQPVSKYDKGPRSSNKYMAVGSNHITINDDDDVIDIDKLGTSAFRPVNSLLSHAPGFLAVERTNFNVNLKSSGIKPAVPDNTPKSLQASTDSEGKPCLETILGTDSKTCLAEAEVMDRMDSRRLLKPVPEDIMVRLRAKAGATSKSLHFLERTYQLNTTTTDWLNLLIEEDLTINLSDVMPSYMKELLKLVDEEIASQKSLAVKASLRPHQHQLQKMLVLFQEGGLVNENESFKDPKSKNLPMSSKSNSSNVLTSSSMMNLLQSPQSPSNQDLALHTNAIKETQHKIVSSDPGIKFLMKMPGASPMAIKDQAKKPDNTERGEEEENDDDTPKDNPFTPVVENDSVCSMRCKIFVKKDPSEASDTPYQNRGVGMLFVKPINSGKLQVVVRADNSLGNIILNVCVTSEIPVEIANKNTLMLVCCPMQGEAPRTILIRVKSKDEVDLLHKSLQVATT